LLDEEVLRLLMVMSHDTRGSLIAIGAGLKMLSRGHYGRMDESAAGKLSELYRRTQDLVGMAEEFLAEAFVLRDGTPRMSQGGIDLRSDVIGPVLDELSVELQDHRAKVKADLTVHRRDGLLVTGNRTYLKAVVRNLVRNAIHHGGEGCTISVKVEDDGPFYRVHVTNTGPAIPPEIRDDLFEPAPRASFGDEARAHGMGFGLFLVKEIVRKHGGEIWHEPGEDGTSFVFTLPRSEYQSEYFHIETNQDFRQDGRRPDGLDRDGEPDRAHS
jgi:signal transduction histidine kinase